jgi:choline dehydrogenase-like flavoprotein
VKRAWLGGFNGHGEMLPRWENHCRLDGSLKDRWGIPALHIDCAFTDNERAMAQDMAASYQEMIELAGAKQVSVRNRGTIPGDAIHECGTARMGSDPRNSYLNAFNQSHSAPNLFVTDGASLTSSANQNPTLTLMALTLRASRYAVRELRAGRI